MNKHIAIIIVIAILTLLMYHITSLCGTDETIISLLIIILARDVIRYE